MLYYIILLYYLIVIFISNVTALNVKYAPKRNDTPVYG